MGFLRCTRMKSIIDTAWEFGIGFGWVCKCERGKASAGMVWFVRFLVEMALFRWSEKSDYQELASKKMWETRWQQMACARLEARPFSVGLSLTVGVVVVKCEAEPSNIQVVGMSISAVVSTTVNAALVVCNENRGGRKGKRRASERCLPTDKDSPRCRHVVTCSSRSRLEDHGGDVRIREWRLQPCMMIDKSATCLLLRWSEV
jgi:hypothetical protein